MGNYGTRVRPRNRPPSESPDFTQTCNIKCRLYASRLFMRSSKGCVPPRSRRVINDNCKCPPRPWRLSRTTRRCNKTIVSRKNHSFECPIHGLSVNDRSLKGVGKKLPLEGVDLTTILDEHVVDEYDYLSRERVRSSVFMHVYAREQSCRKRFTCEYYANICRIFLAYSEKRNRKRYTHVCKSLLISNISINKSGP